MIYLDSAASTKISERAKNVLLETMTLYYANPSSLHDEGIKAKKRLNQARKALAEMLHVSHKNIIFTASGTEANNLAIKGPFKAKSIQSIFTTTIEHHSVLNSVKQLEAHGFQTTYLAVDCAGYVDLDLLEKALKEVNKPLVSIIYANNEIGTVQPVQTIYNLVKKYDGYLHLDMVQAPLHHSINFEEVPCDLASFSAHKFHGPRGVGFLYVKDTSILASHMDGGQHEFKLRAGTENLPGICAMVEAFKESQAHLKTREERLRLLSKYFIEQLDLNKIDYHLNGPSLDQNRIHATLNIGFKDQDAQTLSFALNQAGIYVTLGSACSSESIEPSHVLKAIQVPKHYIEGCIRFSLSHEITKKDIDTVVDALIEHTK